MSKPATDTSAPAGSAKPTAGAGAKPAETPANQPPDEMQIRQSAIVASTFANLQLLTTKETLKQYSGLYQAAKEDLTKVNEEMVERDRDNMKVVDHLRAQNKDITEKLKRQRATFEDKIDAMKTDFAAEKNDLNLLLQERDAQIAKLNVTVDQQQADLDSLNAFKRERHEIHTEVSHYKQRQTEIALEHEQEMSKVKFAALEERVRLKAEERSMRERFETEVSAQAAAMLDVKTRAIHAENAQFIEDKVMQQNEIDRLTRENRQLKSKYDEQRRELELSKEAESAFSVRCAKQTIENKELRKQIQALEQNLAQVIETYEGKLRSVSDVSTDTVSKLQTERDEAYRNAQGRQKELLKLRNVAKQVVQQRGELEMFFHEALAFVRNEILAERAEANRQLAIEAQHEHLLRIKGGPENVGGGMTTTTTRQTRSQLHQFLPKQVSNTHGAPSPLAASSDAIKFSPTSPQQQLGGNMGARNGGVFSSGYGLPSNTTGARSGAMKLNAMRKMQQQQQNGGKHQQQHNDDGSGLSLADSPAPTAGAIPQPPNSAPSGAAGTSSSVPVLPAIGRTSSVASSQSSSVMNGALVSADNNYVTPTSSPSKAAGYMAHTATTAARHQQMVASQSPAAGSSNANSDFVDIADLSWSEKERVLRILFAKINSKESLGGADGGNSANGSPNFIVEEQPQQASLAITDRNTTAVGGPIASQSPAAASKRDKRYLRDDGSTTFFTQ